ncbi:MAG: GNAT family N-acetyltransferase [Comamonadaceae bacterium]|nr:MAG: GNAT family N-acetyltransferase [Comamonadaceae bacterium]
MNPIRTSDSSHAGEARATFRRATAADLPHILALLADDAIAAEREGGTSFDAQRYITAFENIDKDPNQLLAVIDIAGELAGTLQLTFIPGLLRGGAWRGQIEAVRVSTDHRGEGLGQAFLLWAIEACRDRGCLIVQLTTDRRREDAHRFYERLGFEDTHLGYKLIL